jgi:uncharacterized protein involved in type VI secretion and phage assembly
MTETNRYYGIYPATVENNIDPEQRGRIMVVCPDVGGLTPSTWVEACVPIAGKQMGMFVVPQIGSGVWLQFQGGDPDRPVWIGCYWGSAADVPALALAGPPPDPNIVIQSMLQNAVIVSDLPGPTGGVMLKSATGATIVVNDIGITIQNGKGASISMVGPTVTINAGALVIT